MADYKVRLLDTEKTRSSSYRNVEIEDEVLFSIGEFRLLLVFSWWALAALRIL